MDGFGMQLAVALAIGLAAFVAVKYGVKLCLVGTRLVAVSIIVAPRAYAAANAEASLPARDLAFDMAGDRPSARAFSAIVDDLMTRTQMIGQSPSEVRIATNLGRYLAQRSA